MEAMTNNTMTIQEINEDIAHAINIAAKIRQLVKTDDPERILAVNVKLIMAGDAPADVERNVRRMVIAAMTLAVQVNNLQKIVNG